jgi:hypothetical protein
MTSRDISPTVRAAIRQANQNGIARSFYQSQLHSLQRDPGISWPAFITGGLAFLVAVVFVTGQVNGWW